MLSTVVQSRRSRIRAAAVALTAAAALLASATPALAHDELVSSNPAADARVAQPPTEVVLTFDEAVLPVGTQVVVTGPDGPVSEGSPRLEGPAVHQPLRGGPAGTYKVAWRVTSADGHPVSGTFAFTAQAASPPTSTTTPPSTTTTPPAPSTTTSSTVSTPATSTTPVVAAPASGEPSGSPWLVVLVVLVVAALALGGWALYRRRGTPPESP
jgi:copper resistance protein C